MNNRPASAGRFAWLIGLSGILLLGLTPLLWFLDGMLVTGGDHVFPLDPYGFFLNRLNVWDHRMGAGTSTAIYATSIMYHGLQAAFDRLGFSVLNVQRATYVVWFTALAASAYALVWAMQRARREPMAPAAGLIAALAYTYNPVMFNIWEGGKAGELSATVGLPLVLAILVLAFHREITRTRGVGLLGLVAIAVAEWGSPPILGVVVIVTGSYTACAAIRLWNTEGGQGLGRVISTVAWGLLAVMVCSMFWWWPFFAETMARFRVAEEGLGALTNITAIGLDNWLHGISTYTSLFNVMRLQGLWDWYYGVGAEPYVAYAVHYFHNPWLIGLGVALPASAYAAVLWKRDFHTLWCAGMAALMTVLACGTHPPTGMLYEWLNQHLPGFSMFRSPFYKFGLGMILMYGCLVSATYLEMARRWPKYRRAITGVFAGGLILYGFPMTTGGIFPRHDVSTAMSSLKLTIPSYVYDAADWLTHDAKPGRILSVPEQSSDSYTWGFSSTLHLLNYLTDRSVLQAVPIDAQYWERGDQVLRGVITRGILHETSVHVADIARRVGIRYLLVRRDSTWDLDNRLDAGERIEACLRAQQGIRLDRVFGHWAFYEIEDAPWPAILAAPTAELLTGALHVMLPLATQRALDASPVFLKASATDPAARQRLPITGITWFNTQIGDTLLQSTPGAVRTTLTSGTAQTLAIPEETDYLIGIEHPLPTSKAPPELLLDGRLVASPRTESWLPAAERWIHYGVYHLERGDHTVRATGLSTWDAPAPVLTAVSTARFSTQMAEWMPWLQDTQHALRWIVSRNAMALALDTREPSPVTVSPTESLTEVPFALPGADAWWSVTGAPPHWFLANAAPTPQWVGMAFRVMSPGIERDVSVQVGVPPRTVGRLHALGATPHRMAIDSLLVPPGRTPVELYTPFTATTSPTHTELDRYRVGTFLLGPVTVGTVIRSATVYVPRADEYRVGLIWAGRAPEPSAGPTPYEIRLEADPLTLVETPWGWRTPHAVPLRRGYHTLRVRDTGDRPFFIQLATDPPVRATARAVASTRRLPTWYEADAEEPSPAGTFLVQRDAYHSEWSAVVRRGGRRVPAAGHWEADGFANAWWIPTLKSGDRITVRYALQTTFEQAAQVSAGAALVCLALCLLGRRRPARPPRAP